MHHERIDGSGYPMGVKQNQLNDYSRLVAIADIFDAMTSNRSYRKRICAFDVIRNLEDNYYGQLDMQFLLTFTKNIAYSYVGSYVRLSTGQVGVVVFINPTDLSRPTVRLSKDVIDLSMKRDVKISDVL